MKEMPDLANHVKEPATYMWWWWKNDQKSRKKMVKDYGRLYDIIDSRKSHGNKRAMAMEADATMDAIENEKMTRKHMPWKKAPDYIGLSGDQTLLDDLVAIFTLLPGGKTDCVTMHNALVEHVKHEKVGDLIGFGYDTFNRWVTGQRSGKLRPGPKKAMISYVMSHRG